MSKPNLFTTRNYLIDLETLDITPSSVITSAALSQFGGPYFGDPVLVKEWTLNVEHQQALGRTIDASTVLWWLKQPETARMSIASADAIKNQVFLSVFLSELIDILAPLVTDSERDYNYTLWAKPMSFDCVILEHASRQVLNPNGPMVFHRRRMHNVRTMQAAINALTADPSQYLEEEAAGSDQHSASADVLRSARFMTIALRYLWNIKQHMKNTDAYGVTYTTSVLK